MKFKLSDKFIDFAFRHDKGEVGIVAVNEIIYHELIEAGLPKNGIMQLVENAECFGFTTLGPGIEIRLERGNESYILHYIGCDDQVAALGLLIKDDLKTNKLSPSTVLIYKRSTLKTVITALLAYYGDPDEN